MSDDIDTLIYAIVRDITGTGENSKPCLAIHCQSDRRLLALLIAYQLGEELAEEVLGDSDSP